MAKKFSKPELSRKINGDIPFDTTKTDDIDEIPKLRLDMATLERYPRYSRATIQKFIKEGIVKNAFRPLNFAPGKFRNPDHLNAAVQHPLEVIFPHILRPVLGIVTGSKNQFFAVQKF